MVKLPKFFSDTKRPARPATAAELAVKLTEAEATLREAQERVAAARVTLAAERNEGALQAHREAVQAAADVEVLLGITRDEHAAAVAREAAAVQVRQRAEAAAMGEALSQPDSEEARLLEAELGAWGRLIQLRLERLARFRALSNEGDRYRRLCASLKCPCVAVRNPLPVEYSAKERLRAIAAAESDGARQAVISQLIGD